MQFGESRMRYESMRKTLDDDLILNKVYYEVKKRVSQNNRYNDEVASEINPSFFDLDQCSPVFGNPVREKSANYIRNWPRSQVYGQSLYCFLPLYQEKAEHKTFSRGRSFHY